MTNGGERIFYKMAKLLDVTPEKLAPLYETDLILLDTGEISGDEFYGRMISGLELDIEPQKLKDIIKNSYQRKEEVIEYVKELKNDFEIALLTNFGDYFDECDQDWRISELFDKDKLFVSCRLGMRKPDEKIFEYVLDKLGKKAEEVIYVDDQEKYLEGAKRIGMHTLIFKDLEGLKTDIEKIVQIEE